jgi:diguanylate cyclase (GGDEF)-like protein
MCRAASAARHISQDGAASSDGMGVKRLGWLWWLALAVPAALSYIVLPPETPIASVCFEGVGFASCVTILVGIRRRRPARPLLWYLLLAGTVASVLGDAVYDYLSAYAHVQAFPSLADPFYLASYPLTAAGLMLLIRSRTGGRDRAGLLDAAVVSTALGLLSWTFLVRPIAAQYNTGELDQLVSLSYPIGDVLLIAMTARLLTAPERRSPAYWMLVIAQLTRLLPDVTFSIGSAFGTDPLTYFDSGWLLTYVLTAAAALHPSMRRLSEPIPAREVTLSVPRLSLLTSMSLLAPAVLVVQGRLDPQKIDWAGVAVGSAALFLLVLVRMRGLLDQMRRQAQQLESLAHADGLTGVPNRRAWDDALRREVAEARRAGTPLVVGLLDLDFFKKYNDTHGHQAGDALLTGAAAAWRAELREADLLARYGGEEFGVIVKGLPAEEALAIVERLRAVTPGGQTFSAGLARCTGTESPEELVRRADRALYRAKENGRDRIVIDPSNEVPPAHAPAGTVNATPARA